DDLVGHEPRVRVAAASVVRIVVALAGLDVVGEFVRDDAAVGAVLGDQVGDVVADHAAEPAALLAGVGERLRRVVGGDVGRGGDADGDLGGVPAGGDGRVLDRLDHVLGEVQVGELQDEPVGLLAG